MATQRQTRRTGEGGSPLGLHNVPGLPPESALICAVLRQVVIDISQKRPSTKKTCGWVSLGEQLQAIEWIFDRESVSFWADLLGLDGSWLQEQLAVAAGLSTDPARLGERPGLGPRRARPHTKRNLHHA